MKTIKYLTIVMVIMAFTACKKDQYYLYNDVARLQFGPDITRIYDSSFDLADTLKPVTFYYDEPTVTRDTVMFDIYTIGGISKVDRTFKLEQVQVPGVDNAVAGKHYIGFTDAELNKNYVIKAGAVHSFVPVILLRDPSLKTGTVVLKFDIVANENFQLGELSKTWRKVQLTDRLSQPAAWNASATQYYYGNYSLTKHQFMIESTGQKWDDEFMNALSSDYAQLTYWRGVLKTALVNYNNAHPGNPLVDEFGELVTFP